MVMESCAYICYSLKETQNISKKNEEYENAKLMCLHLYHWFSRYGLQTTSLHQKLLFLLNSSVRLAVTYQILWDSSIRWTVAIRRILLNHSTTLGRKPRLPRSTQTSAKAQMMVAEVVNTAEPNPISLSWHLKQHARLPTKSDLLK